MAWRWVRGTRGHCTTKLQLKLLGYVRKLLPYQAQVSLVGDCEFGNPLRGLSPELKPSQTPRPSRWRQKLEAVSSGDGDDARNFRLLRRRQRADLLKEPFKTGW